jgi:catechol 2,3-dioxygenase-like lactoylglutathione lyase family enzyme
MSNESAVEFATNSRIHLGLAVSSLEASSSFYRALFGQEPTKVRPRYAKFEVAEPPVNLTLNEVSGETGPNNPVSHFGIQVKSSEALSKSATRLEQAGIATRVEDQVTCCYAVQNKVWARDPDGNQWEVYMVLDDQAAHQHALPDECCVEATGCCSEVDGDSDSVQSRRENSVALCCKSVSASTVD